VVPLHRVARVVLLSGETVLAMWDIECEGRPALALVDELARLHLAARRLGWSIALRDTDADLAGVIELAGLSDVLSN
jgi:hypothetical protein